MGYLYGMPRRPFSIGCQPMDGLVGTVEMDTSYFDILLYNRKLSKEEIEEYELDYLGEET